ncbi:MAG: hypothetical protein ACO1NO_03815 [Burkholderiaceae bacterium]
MTSQHSTPDAIDLGDRIPLADKLAYLMLSAGAEGDEGNVETIETHMSWIFLTCRYAYKLKKPVFYDPIDFRTVQKRHFYCEEEVRLNRRLAPDVYLGTIPLTIDDGGRLQLAGHGHVVDWLVKMRRLPADMMLDHKLANGTARDEDADRITATLAGFYLSQPPERIGAEDYIQAIEAELHRSCEILCAPAYALAVERIRGLHEAQMSALHRLRPEMARRVSAGKIIEAHGDLRPEHVCLQENIAIIDCLEFSLTLRTLDMADEIAFLALECERLNAHGFAQRLLSAYRVRAGDDVPSPLIHFYQSFRAMTRAKLAIRHLDEAQFCHSEKWTRRTDHYLSLAEQHAAQVLV